MKIEIICDKDEKQEPIDFAMALINDYMRDDEMSMSLWKDRMAYFDEVAEHIKAYTEHKKGRWQT